MVYWVSWRFSLLISWVSSVRGYITYLESNSVINLVVPSKSLEQFSSIVHIKHLCPNIFSPQCELFLSIFWIYISQLCCRFSEIPFFLVSSVRHCSDKFFILIQPKTTSADTRPSQLSKPSPPSNVTPTFPTPIPLIRQPPTSQTRKPLPSAAVSISSRAVAPSTHLNANGSDTAASRALLIPTGCLWEFIGASMHVDVSVRLTNCYVAFSAELTYGEVVVWFGCA